MYMNLLKAYLNSNNDFNEKDFSSDLMTFLSKNWSLLTRAELCFLRMSNTRARALTYHLASLSVEWAGMKQTFYSLLHNLRHQKYPSQMVLLLCVSYPEEAHTLTRKLSKEREGTVLTC